MVDLGDSALPTSWTLPVKPLELQNDMLSIYNVHGSVVDKLHVVSDAFDSSVHGLSVSKTSAGDLLVTRETDFCGSLVTPTT